MRFLKAWAMVGFVFLGSALRAGELPQELAARLLKVVVAGTGSGVFCRDGAMKAALEAQGLSTDSGSKVAWSNNPAEVKALKSQGKLVVSGRPDLMGQGAGVVLVEENGKPKILLNPGAISASGVSLSDTVLKVGERL